MSDDNVITPAIYDFSAIRKGLDELTRAKETAIKAPPKSADPSPGVQAMTALLAQAKQKMLNAQTLTCGLCYGARYVSPPNAPIGQAVQPQPCPSCNPFGAVSKRTNP